MNRNFIIDEKLCNSCGLCIKECNKHVRISQQNHVDPENPKCIRCYHCIAVCPRGAIQLIDPDAAGCEATGASETEKSLLQLFAERRSHRKFKDEEVSDELLVRLINSARFIPSGGNSRAHEFTVLKDSLIIKELKEELTEIYKVRSLLMNNSLLRKGAWPFVDAKNREFLEDANYRYKIKDLIDRIFAGDDPLFYNAPAIIFIHSSKRIPTPKEDCILAGYNITLMAEALGLGSCFVTLAQNAINSSNKCKRIIRLSPKTDVHAVIIVGYPATIYRRPAPRKIKEAKFI